MTWEYEVAYWELSSNNSFPTAVCIAKLNTFGEAGHTGQRKTRRKQKYFLRLNLT